LIFIQTHFKKSYFFIYHLILLGGVCLFLTGYSYFLLLFFGTWLMHF
jgi:hypothetical protein